MASPKVGSYAVPSVQSRPWMSIASTEIATSVKPKRKSQRVVVNPIFHECAQLIDDSLWKSIFESASYGKFPRGFSYREGVLIYKVRSKTFTLEMPSAAFEAIPKCIEFMKKTGKISSEADKERDRLEIEAYAQSQIDLQSCNWSDIKRKKIKDLLIHTFIDDTATEHALNAKQKEAFKSLLGISFSLGHLNKDDIIFEGGRIVGIAGLQYDPASKTFSLDDFHRNRTSSKKSSKAAASTAEPRSKKGFFELWCDLIVHLNNFPRKRKTGKLSSSRLKVVDSLITTPNDNSTTLPTTASSTVDLVTTTTTY